MKKYLLQAALILSFGLSYVEMRLAFGISGFEAIYKDVLSGEPLPMVTQLVLATRQLWIGLAVAIPLMSLFLVIQIKPPRRALIGLGVCAAGTIFTSTIVATALYLPMMTIITGMH